MDSEFCNHYILILEHFHHSPKKLHTRVSPNPDSMLALGSHSSVFGFSIMTNILRKSGIQQRIVDSVTLNVVVNNVIICV